MSARSAGARGIAGLSAEEIVRLADRLKPAGRPMSVLSGLLDDLDGADHDRIVASLDPGDPERSRRLGAFVFTAREVPLARLRPWPGMGGLSREWTDTGSVVDVAARVRANGVPAGADRLEELWTWARKQPTQALIWLRRLPLIVLPEFHARAPMPAAPLTLDDGSHRAVVLALLGEATASCWVGDNPSPGGRLDPSLWATDRRSQNC